LEGAARSEEGGKGKFSNPGNQRVLKKERRQRIRGARKERGAPGREQSATAVEKAKKKGKGKGGRGGTPDFALSSEGKTSTVKNRQGGKKALKGEGGWLGSDNTRSGERGKKPQSPQGGKRGASSDIPVLLEGESNLKGFKVASCPD